MKNVITLSLFLLTGFLFAQTNTDVENSKWINARYKIIIRQGVPYYQEQLEKTTKYCTSVSDTLLAGKIYISLMDCSTIPFVYRGGLRADSDRWYFIDKDSTKEMLLYDFGLSAGDTLKEQFYTETAFGFNPWGNNYHYVSQVDTQMYNGVQRRVIYLDNGGVPWVEGVGCIQGLLWDNYPNISEFALALECYGKNDSVGFNRYNRAGSELNGDCNLSFSLNENLIYNQVTVYPNPSNGSFTFSVNGFNGKGTLIIYNSSGEKLYEQAVLQAKTNIDINLKPGAYLLNYKGDNTFVSSPLVVQ